MCTHVSASGQDELWQKAITIVETNQWIPGQMVEDEQVFNTKGKLEEQTETHVQLLRQNQDKVEWKLLKCIRDGKDITKKTREEVDGILDIEATQDVLDLETPFEPSYQDQISFKRLDQQKTIQGKQCVAFQYTYAEEEAVLEGIAWLEEQTGIPYEIHSALSGSFEEDDVTMSDLKQIHRYTYTPQGAWYLVESEVDLKIELKSLLFKFKGQVRSVTTYSDYWKL
jgi:hypothetical protein